MRRIGLRLTNATLLLLILSFSGFVSCRTPSAPSTVEVEASVNCRGPADKCIAVTRAFLDEHLRLFEQNIRLRQALKICQDQP